MNDMRDEKPYECHKCKTFVESHYGIASLGVAFWILGTLVS